MVSFPLASKDSEMYNAMRVNTSPLFEIALRSCVSITLLASS
jgi:hypothetical protein